MNGSFEEVFVVFKVSAKVTVGEDTEECLVFWVNDHGGSYVPHGHGDKNIFDGGIRSDDNAVFKGFHDVVDA